MSVGGKGLGSWCMVLLLVVASRAAASDDLRLVEAVKNQDRAAVRGLLKQRLDVNTPQPDGATALHWAVHWDDLETADLLIQAGANVNAANDYGVTPLWLACTNANAAIVEALLKAGANPNAARAAGESPLMTAARTGNVGAVKALLAYGADVNAKETRRGQTALMWAVAQKHLDNARVLIEHGADVGARSAAGFTPLLFAAQQGDLDATRMLLAAGANVNETASDGSSVLLVATVSGHERLVRLLLDHGADPNADGAGFTALHWVAGTWESSSATELDGEAFRVANGLLPNRLEWVKALLAHGANPNARLVKDPPRFGRFLAPLKRAGATPFLLAAVAGEPEIMRALVASGADPRLATNDETTPLMAAAGIGWSQDLKRGLSEGSPLETVQLILELEPGLDVNATNASGETAMHGAANRGANAVIQFLVEKGARVDVKDKRGQTPLGIVQPSGTTVGGRSSTAELLRKLGGI